MNMVVDMSKYVFNGDVIDIGEGSYNVIYNTIKCSDDEISIDYVEDEEMIEDRKYDSCVYFLTLGKLVTKRGREMMIKKGINFLKNNGTLYLWDIMKIKRERLDLNLKILMPDDKIKVIKYENKNLFSENNERDLKSMISKYFNIEEVKTSDRIIFIKAKMKGINV